jgi:hypothetical protein
VAIDTARAIAAQLGNRWAAQPDDTTSAVLTGPADSLGTYRIRVYQIGSRLHLRGLTPDQARKVPCRGNIPAISTAARLGAAHAAGHIRRRLLPQMEAARADLLRLLTEASARESARQRTAEQLTAALPGSRTRDGRTNPYRAAEELSVSWAQPGIPTPATPRLSAAISRTGATVNLTLSAFPAAHAAAVLRAVAELHR